MSARIDDRLDLVDWVWAKERLAADDFDNGRSPDALRRSFEQVPGQHVGLQTDDAQAFYESMSFGRQPEFLSLVVGTWLDNEANR